MWSTARLEVYIIVAVDCSFGSRTQLVLLYTLVLSPRSHVLFDFEVVF